MPIKEALQLFFEKNLSRSKEQVFESLNSIAVQKLDEKKKNIAESLLVSEEKKEDEDDEEEEDDDDVNEEQIDELSRQTAVKAHNKAHKEMKQSVKNANKNSTAGKEDKFKKHAAKATKRNRQANKFFSYAKKKVDEDDVNEEQIDELSKKVLGSYIVKAGKDKQDLSHKTRDAYEKGERVTHSKGSRNHVKMGNRNQGIQRAVKKITKEEQIDEISTKKASAYQDKAIRQQYDSKLSPEKRSKRAKGAIRAQDKMDARFHPLSPARVKTRD